MDHKEVKISQSDVEDSISDKSLDQGQIGGEARSKIRQQLVNKLGMASIYRHDSKKYNEELALAKRLERGKHEGD